MCSLKQIYGLYVGDEGERSDCWFMFVKNMKDGATQGSMKDQRRTGVKICF